MAPTSREGSQSAIRPLSGAGTHDGLIGSLTSSRHQLNLPAPRNSTTTYTPPIRICVRIEIDGWTPIEAFARPRRVLLSGGLVNIERASPTVARRACLFILIILDLLLLDRLFLSQFYTMLAGVPIQVFIALALGVFCCAFCIYVW